MYIALLILLVAMYFHARAIWIKRFEMTVLQRSPSLFTLLPSFFNMMFIQMFVWEEEVFLPNIKDMRYE